MSSAQDGAAWAQDGQKRLTEPTWRHDERSGSGWCHLAVGHRRGRATKGKHRGKGKALCKSAQSGARPFRCYSVRATRSAAAGHLSRRAAAEPSLAVYWLWLQSRSAQCHLMARHRLPLLLARRLVALRAAAAIARRRRTIRTTHSVRMEHSHAQPCFRDAARPHPILMLTTVLACVCSLHQATLHSTAA